MCGINLLLCQIQWEIFFIEFKVKGNSEMQEWKWQP
jgi:hypothetical protein